MKTLDCPVIGRRPILEFVCAGGGIDALVRGDPEAERAGLYFGDGRAREKREWWYHRPSRLWFVVVRHTGTDVVSSVALAGAYDGVA